MRGERDLMPAAAVRRRAALLAAFLVAWVAGSVLGAGEHETAGANPLFQIEPAHAEFVPTLNSDEPIFVLVIGSDARPDPEVKSPRSRWAAPSSSSEPSRSSPGSRWTTGPSPDSTASGRWWIRSTAWWSTC